MELDEIEKDIKRLIHELMFEVDEEEFSDVIFENKTSVGDNYAGELRFVKVIPKHGTRTYDVVAKTAKRDKDLNKFLPMYMVYEREVFVYSKLFPEFEKLMEETKSGMKLDFIPKTYIIDDTKGKETLILENLKTKGFKVHNRMEPWNLEHSLITMEHFGKFHALSMALKDQKPEVFKELAGQLPNIVKEVRKKIDCRTGIVSALKNVMELLRKHGREDLVKKYDVLLEEAEGVSTHEGDSESDKLVFCHLDCWNNNFMFKYEGEDEIKPASMYLIDFQMVFPCSPVKDLGYNIYVSCDKSNLDHFDLLMRTYHDSLSRTLRKLGSDPEKLFSFEQMMDHWKKYGKYGLLTSMGVLRTCLAQKEEAMDLAEISKNSENAEDFSKATSRPLKNQEEYNRRVLDAFIHFGDKFL